MNKRRRMGKDGGGISIGQKLKKKKKKERLGQWALWHSISHLSISKGSLAKQWRAITFLSMLEQLLLMHTGVQ